MGSRSAAMFRLQGFDAIADLTQIAVHFHLKPGQRFDDIFIGFLAGSVRFALSLSNDLLGLFSR